MANFIEKAARAALPGFFGKKDAVLLRVGTQLFDSFESIRIKRDMNALCASFDISFQDKWRQSGGSWPLVPGAVVGILIGQNTVINGFIDRVDVAVSNDDRSIGIQGRDRTCDLVDSSATVSLKTEFKNVTIKDIAQSYASLFGILVTTAQGVDIGAAFDKFTIKQGETCFEALERAAKLRGLLILSDELGNIVLSNRAGGSVDLPSAKNLVANFDFTSAIKDLARSKIALVQGQNILRASAQYDETERFQSYTVKGQNTGNDNFNGVASAQVTAAAIDQGVERFRSTTIIAEGPITFAAAQKRVAWEATVRAAKAVDVKIDVQGWLRADGQLWKVNELVTVDAGFIGINSTMLVSGVEFSKDKGSGTITTLHLTRPDAYAPDPLQKKSNDPSKSLGWDKQIGSAITRTKDIVKS